MSLALSMRLLPKCRWRSANPAACVPGQSSRVGCVVCTLNVDGVMGIQGLSQRPGPRPVRWKGVSERALESAYATRTCISTSDGIHQNYRPLRTDSGSTSAEQLRSNRFLRRVCKRGTGHDDRELGLGAVSRIPARYVAEPNVRPTTCQAEGCQRKCEALGLCPAHRHRFARGTAPELKPIVDRFRVYGRSVECGNA